MLDAALIEVSEYGDGVVNVGTGELVPVNDAPLPIVYERADRPPRDKWVAEARKSFEPSERKHCWVCGQFSSITQAHHIFPLAVQWRFGIKSPIHDHEWLCPNHHVSVHILIGQGLAFSVDASKASVNVICDLALDMDKFSKVLLLTERFHAYLKGEQDGAC